MDNSIGDILANEPTDGPLTEAVEEVVETPEVAEAEPVTERPRGPDGKFIPKDTTGETQPVPPTEPTNQLPQAEYVALRDERRKRQELEERLRQFEERFTQSQQPKPQPAPDMFDDPDGFKNHLAQTIRAELMQELQPVVQQHGTLTRAEVSEMLARQKYEDYDATVESFKEALGQNPFLMTQLQQASDPATFAYNAGKQYQQAQAYGGEAPPTREQIEAELREKIMAEIGLKPKAPSSFAGDRSVGARSGPAWAGPTPMGDLLK